MKTEDIEKLKQICEREGFEINESHGSALFQITKKDPWEGVEFVKTKFKGWGFCKKVSQIKDGVVYFSDGSHFEKDYLLPITESEYVDQLKKEAFERLGRIKRGDKIRREWLDWKDGIIGEHNGSGFQYKKRIDLFLFEGSIIYQSGKWAKKLQERVKVSFNNCTVRVDATGGEYYHEIDFSFFLSNPKVGFESSKLGNFLAKQFENYLNEGE